VPTVEQSSGAGGDPRLANDRRPRRSHAAHLESSSGKTFVLTINLEEVFTEWLVENTGWWPEEEDAESHSSGGALPGALS
jgi:hypothetical protein